MHARLRGSKSLLTLYQIINKTGGEFNKASARRALVDWYLSLFIMCKAGHQYNERPRALALLNSSLISLP